MGDVAGLPKLNGDWDYDLIRTPETELTPEEVGYAVRDVQVIPAYLRYLLEANEWMTSDLLGVKVVTKSSIVRQMAARTIGNLKYKKQNGKLATLTKSFTETCRQEHAQTYESYALRKACFRGGLTFTAAVNASKPMPNVCSLDVVSMHHLFINGRFQPVHFSMRSPEVMGEVCAQILETPVHEVMADYAKPWLVGIHAAVRLTNLRLKAGSFFERWGIGTLATAKFDLSGVAAGSDLAENQAAAIADSAVFSSGYGDRVEGRCIAAYGKVLEADAVTVHVTEVELYTLSLVYDWDRLEVVTGEATAKMVPPPDYVTLQSNLLFMQKQDMKQVCKLYEEGTPYPGEVPASLPDSLRAQLAKGEPTTQFVQAFYNSSVKGAFNGIYGTQAQNIMKPKYVWSMDEVMVDTSDRLGPDNYAEQVPKTVKVWFNYGSRIVGGSRLHLVLAMRLIWEGLGERVRPIGGDTDSLKLSLEGCTPDDVVACLKPLHRAADVAIERGQERVRRCFPDRCSDLHRIGHFDVEPATRENVCYEWGMEAWNKCRITYDGHRNHVTMAGVSRPRGTMNVETFADALAEKGVPSRPTPHCSWATTCTSRRTSPTRWRPTAPPRATGSTAW